MNGKIFFLTVDGSFGSEKHLIARARVVSVEPSVSFTSKQPSKSVLFSIRLELIEDFGPIRQGSQIIIKETGVSSIEELAQLKWLANSSFTAVFDEKGESKPELSVLVFEKLVAHSSPPSLAKGEWQIS